MSTGRIAPILSQMQIQDSSLCRRSSFIPKPLPEELAPLSLDTLYTHICNILTFQETKYNSYPRAVRWRLPGDVLATYLPPETLSRPELNSSQVYLKFFLEYFINVKNYIQFENHFGGDISLTIVTHILSFAWTLLNNDETVLTVASLQEDSEDEELTIQDYLIIVMKIIRIFSRLDSLAASIGQKQGISVILRAMEMPSLAFCIPLQVNCSACLANLASVESNRTSLLSTGCIRLVLENMSRFLDHSSVLAEICATLANLACHEANAIYIVSQNGVPLILQAMRIHISKAEFLVQAFHSLSSLGKSAKDILNRENFISIVMRCMKTHITDVDLTSAAWHAMGSLANAGLTITHSKPELITLIFESMKRFKDNYTFQITACFAIAHVFFNHRDTEVDDDIVANQKGIECLLNTIKRFPQHESLQTTAIFALGSIVMKSENHRQNLLRNNGIKIILESMGREYGRAGEAIPSKSNIASDGPSTSSSSPTPQQPEPVLYSANNSKIQCSKPLLLQLFGCVALLNLAESENCRQEIISLGGVHYIFQASRKVSEQSDLWFIVYYIFSKFTKCREERVVYMTPKGIPRLGEIARKAIANDVAKRLDLIVTDEELQKRQILEGISSLTLVTDETEREEIIARTLPVLPPKTETPQEMAVRTAKFRKELLSELERVLKIPKDVFGEFTKAHQCKKCKQACFSSRVRMYEVNRSRQSITDSFCSLECAKQDPQFPKRILFRYNQEVKLE